MSVARFSPPDPTPAWRAAGRSPVDLLVDYAARNGLTQQEVDELGQIVEYAVECDRAARVAAASVPVKAAV